jgi:hypothetical protein
MPHYTPPRVVSVRLPGDVFEALKAHAKDEGRSVSGSVAHLVKEEVANRIAPKKASKALTGFLSHFDVPRTLDDWRLARRETSKKLAPGPRASRRIRAAR